MGQKLKVKNECFLIDLSIPFSAATLLVGQQKGIRPVISPAPKISKSEYLGDQA